MPLTLYSSAVSSADVGNAYDIDGPLDFVCLLDFENDVYRLRDADRQIAKALADAIAADRSTVGMVRDDTGTFISVAANTPRIHRTLSGRKGLLSEPSRTNYLLNSFAPATQNRTIAAGTYILSVEGTGQAVVTGDVSTGNGVAATEGNPVIVEVMSPGNITITTTGALTWFQLENSSVGHFATTPITTAGASVQRVRDLNRLGAQFLAKMGPQGTIIMHVIPTAPLPGGTVSARWIYRLGKTSSSTGAINVQQRADGGIMKNVITDAGVSEALFNLAGTNSPFVMVSAYKENDCAIQRGNAPIQTETSNHIPTFDQLELGSSQYSVIPVGLITRVLIYDRRLTDDEINALARQAP